MNFFHFAISIITGSFLGITYGLLFLHSRRRALLNNAPSAKKMMFSFAYSALRIVLIALVLFYLLRLDSIKLIILLPSFLVAFWILILLKKA